ncbi:MAG: RNA methyltransferase [Bacteroidaceae bacterium]|nr:RNA methyltransferase [Bacteroidaceae bacterium]
MTSELIAKTFQGLEPLLAQELTELGASDIQIGRRMVTFIGDKEMMYRANFCLRTAIRILKPIKQFKSKSADDVYNAVKEIDWTTYLSPETTFAVDSVVFSPEFHHSKFVAYKVKDAIADQFRERTGKRPNVSVTNPDIQLHIHISDYDATLALDSSGESLHRRGYRQESVAAPLNEVLAAGIILMTGWRGESDFLDPFCGSGTLCIEAALIARGIAPGVFRQGYAFEKWPDFDRDLFEQVYNDDSNDREFTHHIYGRDIDPKAVGVATRNVRAAGLSKDITIAEADFTKCPLLPADGQNKTLLITNPPYGERISSPDLQGLYKTIGQKLKREFTGGEAWILSYREECFEQIGLKPSLKTPLFNGSLECELRKYVLFDGRLNDHRANGGMVKTEYERRQMAEKHRFKQKRSFFKGEDDEAPRPERSHGFNKYARHERTDHREEGFRGRRGGFGNREDDFDKRGGKRDGFNRREGFDKRNGFNSREGFGGRGGSSKRGDYRAKGNDRAARQEARRRFFGGHNDNED